MLALDTLYINGMLTMLVFGIRSGTSVYFDIALLIALFGFVGSTAMARSCCARGDRAMIESQIPLWAGIPASILLGGSAGADRLGRLLRLFFYARIHAPRSAICWLRLRVFHAGASALSSRPVFHEVIITLRVLAGHRHVDERAAHLSRSSLKRKTRMGDAR